MFYLDPPYPHATRSSVGEYEHEMTLEEHTDLLIYLGELKGKFILSGYSHPVYDDFAYNCRWNRIDFDLPNNASSAKTTERKTELLWKNF